MKNITLVNLKRKIALLSVTLLSTFLSTTTFAQTSVCQDDSVYLTLAGYTGTIQWQESPTTVTWTNITGATNDTLGFIATSDYYYRAAVTDGTCQPVYSDTTYVTVNDVPTVAAAGPDQTGAATCGLTTVTLAANAPTVGTGAWTITAGAGGTVTAPTSPTSTFTGTAGTAYTVRWTISNAPCTASFDDVNVTFNQNPTVAAAGPDQTGAATCGLTTVTLAANASTVGTGAWTIIAGAGGTVTAPTSPTSTFTGTAGTAYTLRWTISNAPCTASFDDMNVTFNQNPTAAAAGPDQTGAATCGITTVTLAANAPTVGTGAWTITAGAGGTVTTPTSPTSTFTGTAGTAYTLRWAISNAPCTASFDDVNVTFNQNPTVAAAGPDQNLPCGNTTATLAGNSPTVGTGAWTVVSGTATITTPTSPTSGVTGLAVPGTATLRWTISNAPCADSFDEAVIITTSCFTCGSPFTDTRDGKSYNTVLIGSQCWMSENLAYLPSVVGPVTGSGVVPYYYVYGYTGTDVPTAKAQANYTTYGVLYNWTAFMNDSASCNGTAPPPDANVKCSPVVQGACPAGWHVPSHYEWTLLEKNVGSNPGAFPYDVTTSGVWLGTDEGGNLKETGTTHWTSPNTGATNSSGFTALPGGYRGTVFTFSDVGLYGHWWTALESGATNAWTRDLNYTEARVNRGFSNKANGFSCRCVKD